VCLLNSWAKHAFDQHNYASLELYGTLAILHTIQPAPVQKSRPAAGGAAPFATCFHVLSISAAITFCCYLDLVTASPGAAH
jgi:hypothetical protein